MTIRLFGPVIWADSSLRVMSKPMTKTSGPWPNNCSFLFLFLRESPEERQNEAHAQGVRGQVGVGRHLRQISSVVCCDKPGKHFNKLETRGHERDNGAIPSPAAPLPPSFHHLGPTPRRGHRGQKKETLGDPLHQFFLLADEATGRGCGLLGITLRVLLRGSHSLGSLL